MAFEVPPPEALPVQAAAAGASRTSTTISLALLVVSVIFATAGQLTLKAAMQEIGRIGSAQLNDAGSTILKAVKEPRLWVGLTLFGISALFWLVGLSYIVVVVLSQLLFHEHVPPLRWAGVVVIAVGIGLIGLSSKTITGR
jgi:drug/metabolite transporter (DMT)-like permease